WRPALRAGVIENGIGPLRDRDQSNLIGARNGNSRDDHAFRRPGIPEVIAVAATVCRDVSHGLNGADQVRTVAAAVEGEIPIRIEVTYDVTRAAHRRVTVDIECDPVLSLFGEVLVDPVSHLRLRSLPWGQFCYSCYVGRTGYAQGTRHDDDRVARENEMGVAGHGKIPVHEPDKRIVRRVRRRSHCLGT